MTELSSERLHASCVAIGDVAVLIIGRSGSGKSDLAIRLIDRGAVLISDDSTQIDRQDHRLIASAPDTIFGKIELYGVGIVDLPTRQHIPLALVVTLNDPPKRMPEETESLRIAGLNVRMIAIAPYEASAPIKVEQALRKVTS